MSRYGFPSNRNNPEKASYQWELHNLTYIPTFYPMTYAGKPITKIRCHKLVAGSLQDIFRAIYRKANSMASVTITPHDIIKRAGADIYGGCYNYRLKRGGSSLSMHAYGAAIDLDPPRNAFHDQSPHFGEREAIFVVEAFEAAGWTWGGRWSGRSIDGMHFELKG